MRSFSCAPWKRVRIFEEISELFQDAHFRRMLRTFEQLAHLRSRAEALHAVPFARKVLQTLASASIACVVSVRMSCIKARVGVGTNVIDKPAEPACSSTHPIIRHRVQAVPWLETKGAVPGF
jgi:hypothetical protein